MSEKPAWLRVVGGTDHNESDKVIQEVNSVSPNESPNESAVAGSDLLGLAFFLNIKKPVDFESSVKPLIYNEAKRVVRTWSAQQLHDYLSQEQLIWQKPSFTKAALDEIDARAERGELR